MNLSLLFQGKTMTSTIIGECTFSPNKSSVSSEHILIEKTDNGVLYYRQDNCFKKCNLNVKVSTLVTPKKNKINIST